MNNRHAPMLITMFTAFLISSVPAQNPISAGKGSYFDNTTTQTRLQFPANPYTTDDFSQKVITNKWWTTLQSQQYSQPMHPHPASYKAVASGLEMAYLGTPTVIGNGEFTTYAADIVIGVDGMNADAARVASYSHWGVTARWTSTGKLMEATMCNGSPFAFFRIQGGSAKITCSSAPVIWYNQDGVLGITVGTKNFGIFAPTGSVWSGTTTLASTLSGKTYLSVAILPDNTAQTLTFFKQYAYSFIVNTYVSWTYVEKTAQIVTTFTVTTDPKEGAQTGTIFALFRHQWLYLTPGAALAPYTYKSGRGEMKTTAGASFSTTMQFNGILTTMPDTGCDHATLANYVKNENVPTNAMGGNTYNTAFTKYASLAQIADLVGDTVKRNAAISLLKKTLETWFTANLQNEYFYYCKPWSRLVGCPAGYGSDSRFADHHFHYGYFLAGASAVAQFDPQWALPANWGSMVQMLIRDVNSPDDDDPLFGRFAYFEPYEGHGYADGLGGEGDNVTKGNNQESSSESMNFNRSLIHWGVVTHNDKLRDLGIFMYTTESRAIEQYWWDVDHVNFAPDYTKLCNGMIWSNGGCYATWFSADPAAIHAINLLVISAGSLYIGRRPDYITKFDAEGYNGNWDDQFNEMLVFADPAKAMQRSSNGTRAGNMYGANTNAYYYLHMNSVNAAGRLNTNVGADVPMYAVFDKDLIRTYTAYNPDDTARTVAFTDGFTLPVPAKKQVTRGGVKVSVTSPVVTVTSHSPMKTMTVAMLGGTPLRRLSEDATRIEVYDLKGKLVLRTNSSISGDVLKKGIYIVKLYEKK
jgi:endoglucanase Acf2